MRLRTSGFWRVSRNFCGSMPTINLSAQISRSLYWILPGISIRAPLRWSAVKPDQRTGRNYDAYTVLAHVSMKFCLYSSV